MLKCILQVIIDCLGVGLLKSKDEIVSMHVTQVTFREIPVFPGHHGHERGVRGHRRGHG